MSGQSGKLGRAARYLVFGDFTNEQAIGRGLKALGLAATQVDPRAPGAIGPGDTLFFTEEDTLAANMARSDVRLLPREILFAVDDKVAFARQVEQLGVDTVPFAEIGSGRLSPFGYPVAVKGRSSWRAGRRVPRGAMCRSAAALTDWLARAESEGWTDADFFLQRFMPDGVRNVVSACGFFDWQRPERNAVILCRKLLARGSGFETSAAAVGVIDDPSDLHQRTQKLLTALRYVGPFELEFIHDEAGVPYVLELNARYWMQHGLFVRFFGNALIKRYLERDTQADWDAFQKARSDRRPIVWINCYSLIGAFVRGRGAMLKYYAGIFLRQMTGGGRTMVDPPPLATAARIGGNILRHGRPFV